MTAGGQEPKNETRTGIYTIYDRVAQDASGAFLQKHKHVAVAIRTFSEIATDPQTSINRHAADYDLVRLGWVHEDGITIEPDFQTIINARTILDAVKAQETNANG